jgi:hypothetical protein
MDIFCFGDSHARYFKKANTLGWAGVMSGTTPRIIAFDYVAASAKGFAAGENSRFAYKKFCRDFEQHAPEFVCMAYGQVDAEVGHYFRKYVKKDPQSAEADLSGVFDDYIRMAETIVPSRPLVFKGPNPSCMRNDTQLLNYAFRRLVVRISKAAERDAIWADMNENPPTPAHHARINAMAADLLRTKAEKAGHLYFDARSAVEDPDMPGMAKWDYIPAESDVHLCDSFLVRRAHIEGLFNAFDGLAVTRVA